VRACGREPVASKRELRGNNGIGLADGVANSDHGGRVSSATSVRVWHRAATPYHISMMVGAYFFGEGSRVFHKDLGADYFERRSKDQIQRHHVDRLKQLGYDDRCC
jgi:hypothetical protein